MSEGRRWTKDGELEVEREEDERNAGCLLESLGCAGEGCLLGALNASCVVFLIWYVV